MDSIDWPHFSGVGATHTTMPQQHRHRDAVTQEADDGLGSILLIEPVQPFKFHSTIDSSCPGSVTAALLIKGAI